MARKTRKNYNDILFYLLDTRNFLDIVGIYKGRELRKMFNIKGKLSIIYQNQTLINNRYLILKKDEECDSYEEQEQFHQRLFHENEGYLYYLTDEHSIIICSKNSDNSLEIPFPKDGYYKIDRKSFHLPTLEKNFFNK